MAAKSVKMGGTDNVFLAVAAQRAKKSEAYKEAELSMLSWINQLFSRQVIQHFSSKHIDRWIRVVDLHSQNMSHKQRFLRDWAPLSLSQRVIETLVPKLEPMTLRKTRMRLAKMPFPYKVREKMMQFEKQRQISNAFVAGDEANANGAAISAQKDDCVDGGAQLTTEEKNADSITPATEVSAVRRRLARVLVSPDYLMQLFRRHSADEFERVVTGLFVQYERFDCPKPRVTIARVECVSMADQQQTPSYFDCIAPAQTTAHAREWQRVRMHVSRGDVLTIAQCQSPLNPCRFPFLLDDDNAGGLGMVGTTTALLLNPSSDEIERKARELHMALISKAYK